MTSVSFSTISNLCAGAVFAPLARADGRDGHAQKPRGQSGDSPTASLPAAAPLPRDRKPGFSTNGN